MPTPQSCVKALLVESGLSLPNELYNFLCEMAPYIEICYAYSGGWGGGPAQNLRLFVTAGGPAAASFADRLLAQTQQASAHTPKKQKNNINRCSDLDCNQSHALR